MVAELCAAAHQGHRLKSQPLRGSAARTGQMGHGPSCCAGDRACWPDQVAASGARIRSRALVVRSALIVVVALGWASSSRAWPASAAPPAQACVHPGRIVDADARLAPGWTRVSTGLRAPQSPPVLLPPFAAVLTDTAQMSPGPASRMVEPDYVRVRTGRISKAPLRGEGSLIWPVQGTISQGYSDSHKAIDIMEPDSDVVVASDAGMVAYASWNVSGYGYLVIVNHGNGLVTYYAHLFGFYVDVGESVKRGQPLGVLGSTGRSTGPHLHFEIRDKGVLVDPLSLLPLRGSAPGYAGWPIDVVDPS
jgi:murein DD-endopeptidase MepM/ murein hydrolase activator NlpD